MAGKTITLELPDDLFEQLEQVMGALGIRDPAEAAVIGIAEWVSRRKSELDDRDPTQRYVVNEALDELIARQKKK